MRFLGTVLLVFFSLTFLHAQLDNDAFDWPYQLDAADSNALYLGINTLGFAKNNEYFNAIADGYTLFGYQFNPYLAYHAAPNFKISAGVYLQKDFGNDEYSTVEPVFTLGYRTGSTQLLLGTLKGSLSHQLIEPLYDFEKVLVDRMEHGFQILVDKENLFLDGWVDWQHMIYKGENDQEVISGGLSLNKRLWAGNVELWLPLQMVVLHKGGQIDSSLEPLQTYVNTAVGFSLKHQRGQDYFIKSVNLDSYYVSSSDFSGERLLAYEDGSGWYINASADMRPNLRAMLSYWRGHEFISIMGGQLYPSVSSSFKNAGTIEEIRQLLIIRLTHSLQITDNISLTTRFEPFFDLQNNTFEFSHGFYMSYTPQFLLLRKKANR